MSIRPLLNQLKESGIRIEIKDSKLKLNAPEGKLTTALVEKLKNRKQEIIDFLKKNVRNQVEYASIEPMEKMADISEYVRAIKQTFSRWYNKMNHRTGYLWGKKRGDRPVIIKKLLAFL